MLEEHDGFFLLPMQYAGRMDGNDMFALDRDKAAVINSTGVQTSVVTTLRRLASSPVPYFWLTEQSDRVRTFHSLRQFGNFFNSSWCGFEMAGAEAIILVLMCCPSICQSTAEKILSSLWCRSCHPSILGSSEMMFNLMSEASTFRQSLTLLSSQARKNEAHVLKVRERR